VFTRARHITTEQIFIPKQVEVEVVNYMETKNGGRRPVDKTKNTVSSTEINPKDPNWVYSKPFNLTMKT